MDQLLLPYLQASNESERQQRLDELPLVHAAPVVRQALRRRSTGIKSHNQDAQDLYQEIMSKIVQALHDLRSPAAKTKVQNLKQYVARIANACSSDMFEDLVPRERNDAVQVQGSV